MKKIDRPERTAPERGVPERGGVWQPQISMQSSGGSSASLQPLFVRIAEALVSDVRRGRLSPGQRLPGSRTLADTLGVHRNTVLAAFDELTAQGWIERVPARGTFVASDLPQAPALARQKAADGAVPLGFDLPAPRVQPSDRYRSSRRDEPDGDTLIFAGGLPDTRLLPAELLARAYRRALRVDAREVLSYGDARGALRLRRAIVEMLAATRGVVASAEACADAPRRTLLVTRGAQMALHLIGQLLGAPQQGGRRAARAAPAVIAVERYGYPPAWEALSVSGAELVPVPVDGGGLDIEKLAELAARRTLRAVYLTPHHQYPTTVTLAQSRRMRLLELAARERFAVIEDDYDHEFHYDGRPLLPLASTDEHGVVLYVGTLSKIFAPGVRVGWVVASPAVIDRLAALRISFDRQGDLAVEHAVAELLEEGEIARHARRMRRVYERRRVVLDQALSRQFGDRLRYTLPTGGLALWCHAPGVDVDAWSGRAAERGVRFDPARVFAFSGRRRPCLRLGFAPLDEDEIAEGVRRLAAALPP